MLNVGNSILQGTRGREKECVCMRERERERETEKVRSDERCQRRVIGNEENEQEKLKHKKKLCMHTLKKGG